MNDLLQHCKQKTGEKKLTVKNHRRDISRLTTGKLTQYTGHFGFQLKTYCFELILWNSVDLIPDGK